VQLCRKGDGVGATNTRGVDGAVEELTESLLKGISSGFARSFQAVHGTVDELSAAARSRKSNLHLCRKGDGVGATTTRGVDGAVDELSETTSGAAGTRSLLQGMSPGFEISAQTVHDGAVARTPPPVNGILTHVGTLSLASPRRRSLASPLRGGNAQVRGGEVEATLVGIPRDSHTKSHGSESLVLFGS
jgi:hypothetical protein